MITKRARKIFARVAGDVMQIDHDEGFLIHCDDKFSNCHTGIVMLTRLDVQEVGICYSDWNVLWISDSSALCQQ